MFRIKDNYKMWSEITIMLIKREPKSSTLHSTCSKCVYMFYVCFKVADSIKNPTLYSVVCL